MRLPRRREFGRRQVGKGDAAACAIALPRRRMGAGEQNRSPAPPHAAAARLSIVDRTVDENNFRNVPYDCAPSRFSHVNVLSSKSSHS